MRELFYYKLHRGKEVWHLFEPLRVGLLSQRLSCPGQHQHATATECFRRQDVADAAVMPTAPARQRTFRRRVARNRFAGRSMCATAIGPTSQ